MTNLLEETLEILEENDKCPEDISWVGSESYGYFDWDHFEKVADLEYHSGYGSQEIARDLVIVGKGGQWWLERVEYDGAENWAFKKSPIRPEKARKVEYLECESAGKVGWNSLENLNEEDSHG